MNPNLSVTHVVRTNKTIKIDIHTNSVKDMVQDIFYYLQKAFPLGEVSHKKQKRPNFLYSQRLVIQFNSDSDAKQFLSTI